jgi:SAM-dependent methyltransferase
MADLSRMGPTRLFSELAQLYAQHRPDYPAAALDLVVSRAGLGPGQLLVDVGSGTGISSRLFAARGVPVLGIEPNDSMRAKAEAEPAPPGAPSPRYQAGRGEATGLPDGVAAAAICAQAFHWFDAPVALAEFRRVLRPGGWVALLWNERDERDPFTGAYGDVVRTLPESREVEGPRAVAGQALLDSPLFEAAERLPFSHEQLLTEEGLLGRTFSASWAPKEPERAEPFAEAVRAVFAQFQRDGRVVMRYETTVYLARRKD